MWVTKQYEALKDYKILIDELLVEKDIYNQFIFNILILGCRNPTISPLKNFPIFQSKLQIKIFKESKRNIHPQNHI